MCMHQLSGTGDKLPENLSSLGENSVVRVPTIVTNMQKHRHGACTDTVTWLRDQNRMATVYQM